MNKARFRLKIEHLCDPIEAEKIIIDSESVTFSLCDVLKIQETYLSPYPVKNFHLDVDDTEDNQEYQEIRIICTEMVFNSKRIGITQTMSPTINTFPPVNCQKQFGLFNGALLIGPWYLEFGNTSLCVPKRLSKSIMRIFSKYQMFSKVKGNLKSVSSTLSKVITNWNSNFVYKSWEPDNKNFEGNSYFFINDLLISLGIFTKYKGCMSSFMSEMKTFGNAGPSIYPYQHADYFMNSFGFLNIPLVTEHASFDELLIEILEKQPNFREEYPQDYLVLQIIDMGFWMRSLRSDHEYYEPHFDNENKNRCACDDEEYRFHKNRKSIKQLTSSPMKRSTSDSKLDQKKAEKKLQFMGFDLETAWSAVLKKK
jgi:hypothetical protein